MTDDRSELELATLLAALEARLRAGGALITAHWRPGAPPEQVEAALASVDLEAPHEVTTWFGWHDGTDAPPAGDGLTDGPESILLGGWIFYTLDQAIVRRRSDWAMYREVGLPDINAMGTWFPLLALESAAALLCVDCGVDRSAPAPLYILDPWGGDTPESEPRFASLRHLAAEAIRLFDDGRIQPDPNRRGAVGVGTGEVFGY